MAKKLRTRNLSIKICNFAQKFHHFPFPWDNCACELWQIDLNIFSCYAKSPNHYYEHFTSATKSLCGKLWKLLLTVEINNIIIIIIDFLAVWMNDNNPSCHPYFFFVVFPSAHFTSMRDIMRGSYEGRRRKNNDGIKTKGLKHAIELTKKKSFS